MIINIIVISFFILIIFIGLKNKDNKEDVNEYIYAGRKLTSPALIATLVTTWYGGINEIGIEVINNGIVTWVYFGFTYYISAFIYAFFLAPRILKKDYRSVPIAIFNNYGKEAGLLSLTTVFFYLLPASYLIILSQLISEIFNINNTFISIFLATLVSTIYILKGGFKAIVRTDKIQFFFMFAGFAILTIKLFTANEYGFSMLNNLWLEKPSLFSVPGNKSWAFIGMFAVLSFATFLDPSFYQRTFSGRNLKTVQKSILWSIFFWFIFDFMTITSALFYYAINYTNGIDIVTTSPYIDLARIIFYDNIIFMSIFILSILSVVMSTIDSFSFLSSVTINYDLQTILGRKTDIKSIKKTTFKVIFLSLVLSLFFNRALDYWYYFGTYMIVINLIPLLSTLYDIKIKYIKILMCLSFFSTIIWDILIINGLSLIPSIYIGLITGLFIFFIDKIIINYTK